jgi:carboxylesterase type B
MPTEFVCNFYIPALIDFIHFPGNPQLIKSSTCEKYRDVRSQAHQARQTLNLLADLIFVVPMVNMLDAHSSDNVHARTFQYLITKDYPYPYYTYPSWFQGPAHGDDVGFIFQYYIPPKEDLQEYLAVSDKMITYWSNFAKNG